VRETGEACDGSGGGFCRDGRDGGSADEQHYLSWDMKIAEQLMASDFLGIPVLLWICWMGTRVMLLGYGGLGGMLCGGGLVLLVGMAQGGGVEGLREWMLAAGHLLTGFGIWGLVAEVRRKKRRP